MKNRKEFEALIVTYESLTIEQLSTKTLRELTGFGSTATCTLCIATSTCWSCVYGKFAGCAAAPFYKVISRYTCRGTKLPNNPADLQELVRNRAQYMCEFLEEIDNQNQE